MKNKISLVLGSGGARGYAHIGIIETLIKNNFQINSISGSSIGAVVGGFYAAGKLDEFKNWVLNLDILNVLELFDFSFKGNGLIKGEKLSDILNDMLGDILIEELPIPFTAVATDIEKRKEIWIQSGKLVDAIRASIAIPGLFTPFKLKDKVLIDGGVLNPIPIAPVMSDISDYIFAVDLSGKNQNKYKIEIPKIEKEKQNRITEYFSQFTEKFGNLLEKIPSKIQEELSLMEVLISTLDIMQESISKYKIAGYTPDLIISIPKDSCKTLEFHKAYQMIEIGKVITEENLKEFKRNFDV